MSGQSNGYSGGYQPQYGGGMQLGGAGGGPKTYGPYAPDGPSRSGPFNPGNMGMSQQLLGGSNGNMAWNNPTDPASGYSGKYGGNMGMSQQPQAGNGGMMGGSFSPQESAALAAESARLYGNRTPQQQPSAWDAMQNPQGVGTPFGAPDGGNRPPPTLTPPPIIPSDGVRGQPAPLPPPIQATDGSGGGGGYTQWQGMPQYPGNPGQFTPPGGLPTMPPPKEVPKGYDQPVQPGTPTMGQGLLNRRQQAPWTPPWTPDPGYGNPSGDAFFGR
jgi:hypothetical protein